ncbi:MAG: hypothetical protein ACK4WB_01855 [Desulfatiglandales bacterium]
MSPEKELALRVTKEIVIKFIEAGKISLSAFESAWKQIFDTVESSLKDKGVSK